MFYYPLRPERTFAQRVIAAEGDHVRIAGGRVYRDDILMDDSFVQADCAATTTGDRRSFRRATTSSWAIIATTAQTAATGASSRSGTSWGGSRQEPELGLGWTGLHEDELLRPHEIT